MKENKLKRVIIESPYAGKIKRNIEYAKMCMIDSLSRDEAPIASHLLYTQVLDDNNPMQRGSGIEAGLAWLEVAEAHVFYIDYGYSFGMLEAKKRSEEAGRKIEERMILKYGKK